MASSLRCERKLLTELSIPFPYVYAFFRPAGGSFQIEVAVNQAFTTFSFDGKRATDFIDGGHYPDSDPVRITTNSLFQ